MKIVLFGILLIATCGWTQTTKHCGGYGLAEASVVVKRPYACIVRGDTVSACTAMRVPSGSYELAIENDGSLVVYDSKSSGKWISYGSGRVSSDTRLHYNTSGEVQMFSGGKVVWSLQTAGSDGFFCVTGYGDVKLYDNEFTTIWTSSTQSYTSGYPKSPQETIKISTGAIAGICAGAVALVGGAVFLLYRRRAQEPKKSIEQLQPFIPTIQSTFIGSPPQLSETLEMAPFPSGPSETFKASVSYHAQYDGELTIEQGDRVEVIGKRDDGWCRGRVGSGELGWIHISKLELVG
ncbi:hypothetical protein BDR26DRAFT_857217 [Obelidium mucronatum]|nr:hypothetical protein BDR26DRAFT_857217 [Obelidium mucronatum]